MFQKISRNRSIGTWMARNILNHRFFFIYSFHHFSLLLPTKRKNKFQIVVGLGNATLYCQTLTNLYSDPNYQSLNHWSILQTLNRKGVPVAETSDTSLTETVLIQTNPLRIVRYPHFF